MERRAGGVAPLLEAQMADALESLEDEVDAEDPEETRQAAIEVARATLDFQLRHRPPTEIDLARFDLWARQILVDGAAEESESIAGDVTTLEWTLDRFAHTLSDGDVSAIENLIQEIRAAVDGGDLEAAVEAAERLRDTIEGLAG